MQDNFCVLFVCLFLGGGVHKKRFLRTIFNLSGIISDIHEHVEYNNDFVIGMINVPLRLITSTQNIGLNVKSILYTFV